jgi:hypothetical protein
MIVLELLKPWRRSRLRLSGWCRLVAARSMSVAAPTSAGADDRFDGGHDRVFSGSLSCVRLSLDFPPLKRHVREFA